jgi:hypothetical protein
VWEELTAEQQESLEEWKEKGMVSYDAETGEVILGGNVENVVYQLNESGEGFEKVVTTLDIGDGRSVSYWALDMYGGDIPINPEHAEEWWEAGIGYIWAAQKLGGHYNGSYESFVSAAKSGTVEIRDIVAAPVSDDRRTRYAQLTSDPIMVDLRDISFVVPTDMGGRIFTHDSEDVAITNTSAEHNAGVRTDIDGNSHVTLTLLSHTVEPVGGALPLSEENTSEENAKALQIIFNTLRMTRFAPYDSELVRTSNNSWGSGGERRIALFYVNQLWKHVPKLVIPVEDRYMMHREPSLLDDPANQVGYAAPVPLSEMQEALVESPVLSRD